MGYLEIFSFYIMGFLTINTVIGSLVTLAAFLYGNWKEQYAYCGYIDSVLYRNFLVWFIYHAIVPVTIVMLVTAYNDYWQKEDSGE